MIRDNKDAMFNLMEVMRDWYPGKFVAEVERKMSDIYGGYTVSVNSGTSALLTALAGVGVRKGDEVIVPASTFQAPAFAVEQIGARPVFADINPATWNVDVHTIEPLITEKTTAIIVVHLYGLPASMPEIREMADYYEIKVIEDCAEAFMAGINGQYVGSFGDAAIFSFEKSKHLTCGSGGATIFKRDDHARRGRKYSILGYSNLTATGHKGTKDDVQHPDFNRHYTMGYNFRLPELCAAVLSSQLDIAEELVDMRVRTGNKFAEKIDRIVSTAIVNDKYRRGVHRQLILPGYDHTYWTFAFTLPHVGGRGMQHEQYEKFRAMFLGQGGHKFFAGWKTGPEEPHFQKQGHHAFNLPLNSMNLQPRLICMNTGLTDDEADEQAEILHETLLRYLEI
jgi:perosamine synthetase